jgi:phosphatidylinositol glycan class U
MLLSPRSVARMNKTSLLSLLAIPVPFGLYLLDYWMWIEAGSGNPNYIFFQSMAYNMFLKLVIGEFMVRTLQRYKALRLTEKNDFRRLKSSL